MITSDTYIAPDKVEEIKAIDDLLGTIEGFVELKKKGAAYIGECNNCGDPKGLTVTVGKGLYKCFKCGDGGKYPLQYLTGQRGMEYKESLIYLAETYNIDISPPIVPVKKMSSKKKQLSFRDRQLQASGISLSAQQYEVTDGNTTMELERYRKGKLNQYGEIDPTGDDMILVYRTLNGKTVTYRDKRGKEKQLYRVRHKYPEQHLSQKTGRPMKYASPYGSGSHLWLPEYVIRAYELGSTFDTLYIVEGEKKADKLCCHKMLCVGIMGIHNLANEDMPYVFEQLMQAFNVKNVVFLFDQDWRDLSIKSDKPVDMRPRSFCKAATRFRSYFYSFLVSGEFNFKIFIGTHKAEADQKGIDDFLVPNKGKEKEILDDLKTAVTGPGHTTDQWELYDVTEISDYAMKEIWKIHNEVAFLKHYKAELKDLREFKLGKIRRKYNEEEEKFELAQKVLPSEQYWIKSYDKHDNLKLTFDWIQIENFFKNRGIGIHEQSPEDIWHLHVESSSNMIRKVTPRYVQSYLIEYSKQLEDLSMEISRFIKAGISRYLSPVQMNHLLPIDMRLRPAQREIMTLLFKDKVVEITKDEAEIKKHYVYHYWEEEVIQHDFELTGPLFTMEKKDGSTGFDFEMTALGKESEILQFLYNTSCTFWRKKAASVHKKNLPARWVQNHSISNEAAGVTEDEIQATNMHLLAKMVAFGYLLHDYEDVSNTKAIICMDLKDSERGAAEGGTGKSIFSFMAKHLVKLFDIDAGAKDLMAKDPFMFEGVDENTRIIVLDDARSDLDFQGMFSKITNGVKVKRKGKTTVRAGMKKFIINLNGMLRGSSNSFIRRQFLLGFTDYYNEKRTPYDEFGHNLFSEWDKKQWNLFFNLAIQCSQLYLKYNLKYSVPKEKLTRRSQRNELGENFIDWADLKYDEEGVWRNKCMNKMMLMESFLKEYPNQRKYMTVAKIKEKLIIYAKYRKLDFNITKDGERIKSNGKEYLCLSDEKFNPSQDMAKKIDNEGDFFNRTDI